MSDNFGLAPIKEFVKGHTLELITVAASTLAYHIATRKTDKVNQDEEDAPPPNSLSS